MSIVMGMGQQRVKEMNEKIIKKKKKQKKQEKKKKNWTRKPLRLRRWPWILLRVFVNRKQSFFF